MSDEVALLRAIVESPDDLTLRMVYADSCEEHGRSARAALIRGQCFLDPLLTPRRDGPPDYEFRNDARYLGPPDLSAEARESILHPFRSFYEEAGVAVDDIPDVASDQRQLYGVRRGFVERVNLQGTGQFQTFLRHATALMNQTPLLAVNVHRRTYDETDQLEAEALRTFLALEGIGRLRELNLANYRLGSVMARALLDASDRLRLTSTIERAWSESWDARCAGRAFRHCLDLRPPEDR
jgi:uncharacterized protein (TIGR02996 family)